MRYGEGSAVAKRLTHDDIEGVVSKGRQGVMPVLARRIPAAGRGGRKLLPASQRVGKGEVVKFSPTGMFRTVHGAGSAYLGGVKAGAAGLKPAAILPSSRTASNTGAVALGEKHGQAGMQALGTANKRRGTLALGAGAAGGLAIGGSVNKRRFDPEDERRHRLGMATAASGLAGGAALGYAGHQVVRDTQALRGALPRGADLKAFAPTQSQLRVHGPNGRLRAPTPEELAHHEEAHRGRVKAHARTSAGLKRLEQVGRRGAVVRGRPALAAAAGLAGLGGAGALHRMRTEERWD